MGELTAAAVFGFVGFSNVIPMANSGSTRKALWSASAPLVAILVQGAAYWLLAMSWAGRGTMPRKVALVYRVFRIANPVLLAAGLVGALVWLPSDASVVLVLAVWLFGVVEYVNYYVVRLAYPPRDWASRVTEWRRPQLVRDLDAVP